MSKISAAKLAANAANAQKSTGPRSQEGKRTSARNAVRHGLLSRETLLPGEDRAEFVALATGFWQHYKPVGGLETYLLGEAVSLAWRLRRIGSIESGLFAQLEIFRIKGEAFTLQMALARRRVPSAESDMPPDNRAESTEVLEARERLAFEPGSSPLSLAAAFRREAESVDTFTTLSRYEGSIRRALSRALGELMLMQERRNRTGPTPAEHTMHGNAEHQKPTGTQ